MTVDEILAAMQQLIDAATASGEPMPAEDVARYEELENKLQAVRKSEELIKRQAAYKSVNINVGGLMKGTDDAGDDEMSRAFDHFLRTGQPNSDLIQRAQGEATGSAGGYLVPEGFRTKVVERLKAFGGLAGVAETISTDTGNPLPWVTNDDTSNVGEIVAEGNTFASGADLTLGTKVLGAYKYMAGGASNLPLKVSVELLQDSAINIQDFIARKLGERLARKQATDWITGTGVNEPVGLLSAMGGLTSGKTIATNATGPTYSELVDIVHSLDPAYRANAKFILNDAQVAKLRKLLDSQNRPILWDSTMNLGDDPGGLKLLGYDVIVDQACPNPASGNVYMAFGDFNAAYVIRRVKDVQLTVLNELYAPNGQVGFMLWARADGTVQDTNAAVTVTAA